MQLFYQANLLEHAKELLFNKEESRHIAKVLRRKAGDRIQVTNGRGGWFEAELDLVDQKNCRAQVLSFELKDPIPYELHMVVAPTKNNDRFEWFLEKSTEFGVTSITPIVCDHSERTVIKPERFEKIIESAMKQCLSAYKPILLPSQSFQQFLAKSSTITGVKLIAHCEDQPKELLKNCILPKGIYTILIGPEGDFSTYEIQKALEHSFIPTSLGERRLRTETAAIAAVHTISLVNLV